MKFGKLSFVLPTEGEYAANQAGMNTFFGAVLGFVMAGSERLDSLEFGLLLMFVAGIVISILYVSGSPHKLAYALLTLAMIAILPRTMDPIFDEGEHLPDKLQATLLVWTLLAIAVEFLPRRADPREIPES